MGYGAPGKEARPWQHPCGRPNGRLVAVLPPCIGKSSGRAEICPVACRISHLGYSHAATDRGLSPGATGQLPPHCSPVTLLGSLLLTEQDKGHEF